MRKQTMKFIAMKLVRSFWLKACKLDDIPPDSKFVVLNNGNVYAEAYNRALRLYYSIGKG